MIILSIETSCDETGISILEGRDTALVVRGNALASQIDLHAAYGGVFPALAKRAHTEKIIPLLREALASSNLLIEEPTTLSEEAKEAIIATCTHEQGLAEQIITFGETYAIPAIDAIAVTKGPGLEPALWVGINTARSLALMWNKPLYPINHMEGHVVSAFLHPTDTANTYDILDITYPALSLLVSGGHTELVLMEHAQDYKKIGHTVDDAVGEAFDKVARVLGLPYPGGPKISQLAKEARAEGIADEFSFPRPMIHADTFNFSYSGLKTAVLYAVRDLKEANPDILSNETMQKKIALSFENAAIDVLVAKTTKAIREYHIQTLIVGGGVAANNFLRETLTDAARTLGTVIHFPTRDLSTDNSVMIGMAAYLHLRAGNQTSASKDMKADGNWSIETATVSADR